MSDRRGQGFVDVAQLRHHSLPNRRVFYFTEFENVGSANVIAFDVGLARVKLTRLAEMIGERLGALAKLLAGLLRRVGVESFPRIFAWTARSAADRVGLVVRATLGVDKRHVPILL